MATILRAQVNLVNDTALARDVAINTWHFFSDSEDPAVDAALIHDRLTTFYNAIDVYLSNELDTPAVVKYYNLGDAPPRVPILTDNISITPASGDSLPNEVAVCLSFRGTVESGVNVRRRRGRIFLGPFAVGILAAGVGDARVSSGFRAAAIAAAETLNEGIAADGPLWVVFSPTTAGPEPWSDEVVLSAYTPVVAGYVDDAFDTVRSRGLPPTARNNWVATLP